MLSADSLKQLRKTVLNRKVMRGDAESNANCLLCILDRTPGLRYFVLTGSYDQAMKLVRVHKRYHVIQRSSDDNSSSVAENSSATNGSQSPISTTNTPLSESSYVVGTGSDEHTYVESVVKALLLNDNEVLLAVFLGDTGRHLGPSSISLDVWC